MHCNLVSYNKLDKKCFSLKKDSTNYVGVGPSVCWSVRRSFIATRVQSWKLKTRVCMWNVYVTVNEWFQQQNRLTGGMPFRRCRLFNVNSIFCPYFFVTIHIQYILYFVTIFIHSVGVSLISQLVFFLICIFSTVINKNRHCSFLKQPQRTIVTVEPACKGVENS